jgi:hypothetical protein
MKEKARSCRRTVLDCGVGQEGFNALVHRALAASRFLRGTHGRRSVLPGSGMRRRTPEPRRPRKRTRAVWRVSIIVE